MGKVYVSPAHIPFQIRIMSEGIQSQLLKISRHLGCGSGGEGWVDDGKRLYILHLAFINKSINLNSWWSFYITIGQNLHLRSLTKWLLFNDTTDVVHWLKSF